LCCSCSGGSAAPSRAHSLSPSTGCPKDICDDDTLHVKQRYETERGRCLHAPFLIPWNMLKWLDGDRGRIHNPRNCVWQHSSWHTWYARASDSMGTSRKLSSIAHSRVPQWGASGMQPLSGSRAMTVSRGLASGNIPGVTSTLGTVAESFITNASTARPRSAPICQRVCTTLSRPCASVASARGSPSVSSPRYRAGLRGPYSLAH